MAAIAMSITFTTTISRGRASKSGYLLNRRFRQVSDIVNGLCGRVVRRAWRHVLSIHPTADQSSVQRQPLHSDSVHCFLLDWTPVTFTHLALYLDQQLTGQL